MIGRVEELKHLDNLYKSDKFEFLVMYGRRRVGKTTILQEFASKNNAIFFPAREKNDGLNLEDFSKAIQYHFDKDYFASFKSWEDCFNYISHKTKQRLAIIIDEFPYIVDENPTVKSILQHVIDHNWKDNKNIFLVLCGSSISIMETEIMGRKSPLHDRQTSTLEIKPFNYLESALFFPNYSNEDKLLAYGILGGIPRYLQAFDPNISIEDNIANNIVKSGSYLNEEVDNLLKAELRETNVYSSILAAIANGKNKIKEIADYIHEDSTKVNKYLSILQTLRLIQRKVPCMESELSKKSIYVIRDNFVKFYYRYIFTNDVYYAMLLEKGAAKEIMEDISNHMGGVFEDVCKEYVFNLAKNNKFPFIPYHLGKWWGNNPYLKRQDDVDLLCVNKNGDKGIFIECKYTNKAVPLSEYEDLINTTKGFNNIQDKKMWFISKSGFSKSVIEQSAKDGTVLKTIDDLYNI